MKVFIGPYKNWFGPFQLAELLCFWVKDVTDECGMKSKPHWVHQFGEWLAYGSVEPEQEVGEVSDWNRERSETRLYKFLNWIESKRSRTIKVHIDKYDTWSMDDTLSHIILPMLKQLKDTKHGAPYVDDKDVPKELRSASAPPKENEYDTDANHFKRWDYALDEMIFAFEAKVGNMKDWEDQFHTGEYDFKWKKLESGDFEMVRGEKDTSRWDVKEHKKFQKRISNGFRLFGKYFEALWD